MAKLAMFKSCFTPNPHMSVLLFGILDTGIMGLREIVNYSLHFTEWTSIPTVSEAGTVFGNAVYDPRSKNASDRGHRTANCGNRI